VIFLKAAIDMFWYGSAQKDAGRFYLKGRKFSALVGLWAP
jgi:hypothetical protein